MADVQIGVALTGLEPLMKRLRGFDTKVRNRVLDKATDAAASVILERAKELCPRLEGADPNVLVKSLGKKKVKYQRGARVVVMIGARTGFKTTVTLPGGREITEDPSNIFHLVELGHGGPHPAPPHPSLRPAYDEQQGAAVAAFTTRAAEEMAKG